MTAKKSMKRTLISSLLILAICFTMLIGTTFAWFTDSVTSANNIIKSGTLRIGLEYYDTDADQPDWVDASTSAIFDYEKWEPGYVQLRAVRISNLGNLALKYKLSILPASQSADAYKLEDVIDVYCKVFAEDPTAAVAGITRDNYAEQLDEVGTLTNLIVGSAAESIRGVLLPEGADAPSAGTWYDGAVYVVIALHMQESAGNEYQDLSVGDGFSLKLIAAQYTYEEDSFDDQYDASAEYPVAQIGYNAANPTELFSTPDDLHAAFDDDKDVTLTADVNLDGYEWEPVENYSGIFDGAGKTISGLTVSAPDAMGAMFGSVDDGAVIKDFTLENVSIDGKYVAAVVADAETADNLTISGIEVASGTITATGYAAGIVFDAEGSNITIEDCVNRANIVSDFSASGIGAWVTSSTATVNNVKNYGDVTGGNRAGGLFGNFTGTITNSENNGDVTSTGGMPAGGIVGVLSGASTFDHCINTGDVTTTASNINASAAGILGQTPSAAATIKYCINTGNITAENSYAGGIATGLYGNSTSQYCYNSGAVTGNNTVGGNPKYAAGGIAPKAAYGNGDKSQHCLNAGAVAANTNGATCQLTYSNITASYYYDGGALKASSGADADINDALAALNDGASEAFFAIDGGVIKPAALIG
ncbi:MAG: hypothetical protein IJU94_02880 [Clostridia bacterium]|nr:hypothetical protein [Clostridia bacterium]